MDATVPVDNNSLPVKNTFVHFESQRQEHRQGAKTRAKTAPGKLCYKGEQARVTSREAPASDSTSAAEDAEEANVGGHSVPLDGSDFSTAAHSRAVASAIARREGPHGREQAAAAGPLSAEDEAVCVMPQPQTVLIKRSDCGSVSWISWYVDARKLRGNDKQAVSPPFDLDLGPDFPNVTFKMMIYPKAGDAKAGQSFKKCNGMGYIQLKCEGDVSVEVAQVSFKFSIGGGEDTRGPVSHNFAQSAVCGLPRVSEVWDFNRVVDKESLTFAVGLEITSRPLTVSRSVAATK